MNQNNRIELSCGLIAVFGIYVHNKDAIAIKLFTKEMEPYTTATIYIPEYDYRRGEVVIKNYSGNEGIVSQIKELFEEAIGIVPLKYCTVPIYRLKEEYIELAYN